MAFTQRCFKQRKGFALLAAMWLIVVITTIALEFGLQAHERREVTINTAEHVQALAAARAGIETARSHLTQFLAQVHQGILPLGVNPVDPLLGVDSLYADSEAIGNASFSVHLQDGSEFLNINSMTADMWRNFLNAAKLDYNSADKLSQTIINWRSPEWITLQRGATRNDYLRTGALALPTNKNFTSVGELRNVMGMTADIYARIAPYLSVNTSGQVSFNHASAMVLHSLPWFSDEVVSTILATRDNAPFTPGSTIAGIKSRVSETARSILEQNDAVYRPFIANEGVREVLVISTGWAPGGRTHVTSTARLTVDGSVESLVMWRSDE